MPLRRSAAAVKRKIEEAQQEQLSQGLPADRLINQLPGKVLPPGGPTGSGYPPAAHHASHQHSGSDEVATVTPAANAIPKAGGAGTIADGWLSAAISRITSIALAAPPQLSVTGSPLTANGTLTLAWVNQNANLGLMGPASGGAAAPTFRALVAADIPNLDTSKLTSGQLALARGGTGADLSTSGGAHQIVRQNSAGGAFTVSALAAGDIPDLSAIYQPLDSDLSAIAALATASYGRGLLEMTIPDDALDYLGAGTIRGVALTMPAAEFNVSIVSGMTVDITVTFDSQVANRVWAGPTSGSPATPAFRALVSTDIPDLSATYQPLDSDLTSIAALSTTSYGRGFLPLADAAAARTYIGAGTGSGSVTSVAFSAPAIFSVSGSPIISSGTLALSLATQAKNLVWAGPATGADATPTFRALTAADLPATAVTAASYGSASQVATFTVDAAGRLTAAANVAIALAASAITSGEIPRSPLTTRGDLLTQNPNGTHTRLAIGAAARYLRSDGTDPSWHTLDWADLVYSGLTTGQIPRATSASAVAFGALDLANANAITGILPAANGGSGQSSYAVGDLLYASGATALSKLADVATGNALISGGVTAAPSWGKIALATHVSGTLPVANGGTGITAIPVFSVNKNGTDQTGILNSTFTLLTWSTELIDSNNNFASNKFTPTVAGTYLCFLNVYFNATTDQTLVAALIYKNGVAAVESLNRTSGTGSHGTSVAIYIAMNGSTDYLEGYCYQNSGATQVAGGNPVATFFCGAWIGP